MKIQKLVGMVLLAVVLLSGRNAFADPLQSLSLSFGSNGSIVFDGTGSFSFDSAGFDIVLQSGFGAGGASSLLVGESGNIAGTFAIGTIIGSSATVSGTGQLTINAGGGAFTADLTWLDISQTGTGGTLNTFGVLNLSNFTYTGTSADLQELTARQIGSVTATFQFVPAKTLQQLTTESSSTSYSGVLTAAVPEPNSLALLGVGLLSVAMARRRRTSL